MKFASSFALYFVGYNILLYACAVWHIYIANASRFCVYSLGPITAGIGLLHSLEVVITAI